MQASGLLKQFDPFDHTDPEDTLTRALQAARVGESFQLPNGTQVRTVSAPRGAHRVRRYYVHGGGPLTRAKMERDSVDSAGRAARVALSKRKAS